MARTAQAVIDRVREDLQDESGVRYTDPQILSRTVDAIVHARSVRPDLFVDSYATPLPDTLAPAATLPLPDQLFSSLCWYVAGACELRDDEFAVDGRAMTLLQLFSKKLVSGM